MFLVVALELVAGVAMLAARAAFYGVIECLDRWTRRG